MKRIPLKIIKEADEFVVYDEKGQEVAFFPTRALAKAYIQNDAEWAEDGPGEFDYPEDPDRALDAMERNYEKYLDRL